MLRKRLITQLWNHISPILPTLLAGLVCTVCLMSQAAAADSAVEKQRHRLRPGMAIQVHTMDGRTLEGRLIETSGSAFHFQEHDQPDAVAIDCGDVASVTAIGKPAKPRRKRLGTALMVGGFLAATGAAIAAAGTVY